METTIRTTIRMDENERNAFDKFPGRVSMSAIVRCLLQAAVVSDEEKWKELLEREPDLKAARDSIRTYLKSTGRTRIAL
jgi:hypothetical protein